MNINLSHNLSQEGANHTKLKTNKHLHVNKILIWDIVLLKEQYHVKSTFWSFIACYNVIPPSENIPNLLLWLIHACLFCIFTIFRCQGDPLFNLHKDDTVLKKWLDTNFGSNPGNGRKKHYICTSHFTDDSFLNKREFHSGLIARLLLKDDAIPAHRSIQTPYLLSR